MRAAPVLLASVIAFAAIEGAVFHTGVYPWVLSPDASTGYLETILRNERQRPKTGPQVLGIGDSRMILLPRLSNEHKAETGYTFGTIATAGSSTRSWYYMLRDTDPTAGAYRAIVMAMESYDDADKWGDEALAEFDEAKRDALLTKINEQTVLDAVELFIVHDLNPRAMSPKVKGFVQAQSWFQDLTPIVVEP